MPIRTVRKSQGGIEYLATVLRAKASVITRAIFWKVSHASGTEEIHLKLGRYAKKEFNLETLQATSPKSELTLDDVEFRALLQFVAENYEPFRVGIKRYIPIDGSFQQSDVEQLRELFRHPDKQKLIEFVFNNNILPKDLIVGMQQKQRVQAIGRFEQLLDADAKEQEWQTWFAENDWVLGSDFVRILDERAIDTENVADYLVEAYDGFLDIIEIKRPGGGLRFWAATLDHGNYFPSTDLVKAITQATAYVFEIEREVDSQKFIERVGGVRTVKPRCVLVFGRSNEWDDEQSRAYRILNSSYHNLSIMTYDHVLARAKRLLGLLASADVTTFDDDIPF
jgi:Domain of unknown function (DUF4263)